MSRTIDERVVSMEFDNSRFERNVQTSLGTLDKLKASLNLEGASKGLEDVNTAAKSFDVSVLRNGVDAVQAKFSALQVMAITALSNITNSAVNAGKQLISAFTIDPIKTGFQEYETQINAVQTILANTSSKGTTLDQVNEALDTLNTYADKTIYNFTEMTRNIGTFTAAGLDLDTSVSAIQGIANVAAVSGSTSQQASTAMYQLSQALSSGTVKLQDWNSVVNAGMGGQVFQDALKATSKHMNEVAKTVNSLSEEEQKAWQKENGYTNEQMESLKQYSFNVYALIKKNGSFRESLSEGWITSEVLSETLSKMTKTGAAEYLSNLTGISLEQIQATQELVDKNESGTESYSKLAQEMADTGKISRKEALDLLKMADTAEDAATKVKTFSQLMDTLKEAAQSGWTQTWEILIGDFEEAKELWTGVSDYFGDAINNMSQARNDMLQAWADGGGRTMVIDSLKNAFQGLVNIITPIKEAFREVFPPTTSEQLLNITEKVKELTASFRDFTEKHGEQIKSTFIGIFSAIDIGVNFVKNLAGGILKLIGSLAGFSGGFLDMTASIGDWIAGLRDSVKETDIFGTVIDKIVTILQNGIEKIKQFLGAMKEKISTPGWDGFLSVMQKVWDVITKIGSKVAEVAKKIGSSLSDAFRNGDMKNFLDLVNGGLLTGILFGLNKTANSGGIDEIKGMLEKIAHPLNTLQEAIEPVGSMLDEVKNCLVSYQDSLKAGTLQKIAISIGILAASLLVISLIKPEKLTASIAAITALFADLMGGMAVFGKFSGDLKVARRSITMMIGLSVAVLILAFALKTVASVSWNGLVKGVLGVTALMGVMVGAMLLLSNYGGKAVKGAFQMILLAVAMEILVDVAKKMQEVEWESLGKTAAMMGVLVIIAAGLGAVGMYAKKMTSSAIALVIIAAAMEIFTDVCSKMGSIEWEQLGKAGAMMGGVLIFAAGLAAVGMYAKKMISSSIALVIIASSAEIFADVCSKMSGVDWSSLGKAGAMMGGVLIFAAGLAAVGKFIGGLLLSSVALVIIAASMEIFADVCAKFGSMEWEQLGKAGVAVAGILLLAAGLAAIGTFLSGILLASAALLVMAGALTVLAPVLVTLGSMSVGEIVKSLVTIAAAFAIFGVAAALLQPVIPAMLGIAAAFALLGVAMMGMGVGVTLLATGFAALTVSVAGGATALVAALSVIITGILGLVPTIMQIVGSAIVELCKALEAAVPAIIECLGVMLDALLGFIVEYVPKIVDAGLKLIIGLLQGIRDNIQQIVEVAIDIVVNFIEGIASKIPDVIQAGYDLIIEFIDGLATAIDNNTDRLISAVEHLFTAIINAGIKILTASISGFKTIGSKIMNSGFVQGIKSKISAATNSVKDIGNKCIKAIKDKVKGFKDAGKNLVDGLINGIKGKIADVKEAASELASSVIEKAKNIFQIHSPSRVFKNIGYRLPEGMKVGIDSGTKMVLDSVVDMCTRVNNEAENGILGLSNRTKKAFKKVKEDVASDAGYLSGVFESYSDAFVEASKNRADNERALQNAQRTIESFTKALYKESDAYKAEAEAIAENKTSIAQYNKLIERNNEDLSAKLGTTKKYKEDESYNPVDDAKSQIKDIQKANKAIDKAIKKNDSKLSTNRSNKQSRKSKSESFEVTGTLTDDEIKSLNDENKAYDDQIKKIDEYMAAHSVMSDVERGNNLDRLDELKYLKSGNEDLLEEDRKARAENMAENQKELDSIEILSDAKVNSIKEDTKAKKKEKKANEKRIKELQTLVDKDKEYTNGIKSETKAYKTNVAYLEENTKRLNKLRKDKKEYEKQLGVEENKRTKLSEENLKLEKRLTKAQNDNSEAGKKKVEQIQNEIDANNKAIKSSNKRAEALETNLKKTTKTIKTVKREVEDTTEAFNTNMEKFYREFHDNISGTVNSFLDPFNIEYSSRISDILADFSKVNTESSKTRAEMLESMKSQVDGVNTWKSNLERLSKHGISDALLSYLKSLGPSAVNEIQTFIQMTDEELEQANAWFAAKQKMEGQSLLENYKEQAEIAKEWAENFELVAKAGFDSDLVEEIAGKGIEEGNKFMEALLTMNPSEVAEFNKAREEALTIPDTLADKIYASLVYSGSESAEAYREALKAGLTKEDNTGKDMGNKIIDNVSSAIVDNANNLITALTGVTVKGKKAAKEKVKEAFPIVGKALINGFVKGIDDNELTLSQKITNMAKNAVKAAKVALGIHSPSRVFAELGAFVPMGFALGIDDESDAVGASATTMAEAAVENAKGVIARIADVVNSDTEVSPTIRPVLDFSNMGDGNMSLGTSIGVYLSRPVDSLSQVISNAQAEINASNNEVIAAINGLRADLNALYSDEDQEIALYVDSKKLASSLAKPMNRQLNILSKRGAY